jgi:hemerythrin-like domain-containing protein
MKRGPELRALSDDHHRALVLAKRAAEAAAEGGLDAVEAMWRAVRLAYQADLAPHFAIEEALLLPPLSRAGAAAMVSRVEKDHASLRAWALDGPHDSATLAAFGERLRAHVRFEERELFPFAEANLAAADLGRVARAAAEEDG